MYQIDSSKRYNVCITCGDVYAEHENAILMAVEHNFVRLLDEEHEKECIYTGLISVCIEEC